MTATLIKLKEDAGVVETTVSAVTSVAVLADIRPDPLSNIRPIIYATPLYKPSNSPYSASEFPMLKPSEQKLYELQMSTKMHKERVDMENHRFWVSLLALLSASPALGARPLSLPYLQPAAVCCSI
jgi:hypothetical protein